MNEWLLPTFIYLGAAVFFVSAARYAGLDSVPGYLLAGIVIGPLAGLVDTEATGLKHFAEFGIAMMMFMIGLEIEPRRLWKMKGKLLGLGSLQMLLTTAVVASLFLLLGYPPPIAIFIGSVFSLSSTAIALQTLKEKKLSKTEGGRSAFSVLIFQDAAVIPLMSLIPLLSQSAIQAPPETSWLSYFPVWVATPISFAAIILVVLAGRFLSYPLFHFVARAKLQETFTAVALLLVVSVALLMTVVGLSPALGTFVAGVALANSEFRHELERNIEPFRGILMGLFFITVGFGVDFGLIADNWYSILGLTLFLMLVKAGILAALAYLFGMQPSDRWLFSLGLAQSGEFCFVLFSLAAQYSVLTAEKVSVMILVATFSMILSPLLFFLLTKSIFPRIKVQAEDKPSHTHEEIEKGEIIVAGGGRFGRTVSGMLRLHEHHPVIFDNSVDLVQEGRESGDRMYYGDVKHRHLLHSAGLKDAKLLIVVIDDIDQSVQLVHYARREVPEIHIIACARNNRHFYMLHKSGADTIVQESFDSAVRAGRYALEALGMSTAESEQVADSYAAKKNKQMRSLAAAWHPNAPNEKNKHYLDVISKI